MIKVLSAFVLLTTSVGFSFANTTTTNATVIYNDDGTISINMFVSGADPMVDAPAAPVNSVAEPTVVVLPSLSTQSTSTSACTASGSTLGIAISQFNQQCPNVARDDCDPVNGGWVCSSAQIGAGAPSNSIRSLPAATTRSVSTATTSSAAATPTPAASSASVSTAAVSTAAANIPTPQPNWIDSYSSGGQCYCASTFDHGIGTQRVNTLQGVKTVAEVCRVIGAGPGIRNNPRYNDVQCGHGPSNGLSDERLCPGRIDRGTGGCNVTGPTWNLDEIFPDDG